MHCQLVDGRIRQTQTNVVPRLTVIFRLPYVADRVIVSVGRESSVDNLSVGRIDHKAAAVPSYGAGVSHLVPLRGGAGRSVCSKNVAVYVPDPYGVRITRSDRERAYLLPDAALYRRPRGTSQILVVIRRFGVIRPPE